MEMEPIPGYSIASWEQGYGDFAMRPDLDSLRRIPWLEGTALVLCDVTWQDGSPVPQSPPGRLVSLNTISVATAPHDSDVLTAIRSCSVLTVSTGVAFWNLLGSAK